MRVLVVDDDLDILESTSILLELEGHDVATVSSASEILPALARHAPDVVLQDVNMPGLEVEELVRTIRARPEHDRVAILLFTAAVQAHEIHARARTDGVITKPVDVETLLRRLEDARRARASAPR